MRLKKKKKRKWRMPRLAMDAAGIMLAQGIRTWMGTLDIRAAYYDRTLDPQLSIGGPRIYIFWHENILIPLSKRGHCNLTMLLSQHDDAELLSRIAEYIGFKCVRGSTYRGGTKAVRELCERGRREHLTLTPDGPRGPRRELALGPIYLASRLQLPLVPMGFGADRPWRVNSWDRFAIPRPFSRARAIIGPPILISPELNRLQQESCRKRVELLMNDLTTEAESWAESGTMKIGEVSLRPGRAPRLAVSEALPESQATISKVARAA